MRVALVTGASSGIGAATVARLLAAGWTVYATARRVDRLAPLADQGAHVVRADLLVAEQVEALVARVLGEQGRLDLLVNNAGYGAYGSLEEVPLEAAYRQVEVNLMAVARLTRAVLPAMRAQRSGRIVNISSIGGRIGEPMGTWYHATKFAVEGLSDSLRLEVAPFGIDVVVVQPGGVRTEWGEIAADELLSVSGKGPYQDQARLGARALRVNTTTLGADPERLAAVIVTAATARRPRTRYTAPASARAVLAMRAALSDRSFDRVFMALYRRTAARHKESVTAALPEVQRIGASR